MAKDVELPTAPGPPIKALGLPLDGLMCKQDRCSFITINIDTLRMHVKGEHAVAWKGNTAALYRRVKVQTFFCTSGLQRYFVVNTTNGNDNTPSMLREVADVVSERLAEWKRTKDAHKEEAQVMDAQVAKTDKTGWFKRTGWLEHFAGRNLIHLAHQTRLPDHGEVKLQRAAKLVELLVERSVRGLSTLAQETRRWLKSAKRQEVDQRPMARLQNPESQARYARYMVKFVCYVLRFMAEADAEARLDAQGGSSSSSSSSSSGEGTDEDEYGVEGDDREGDSS